MNLRQMLAQANARSLDSTAGEAGKTRGVTFRTGAYVDRRSDKRHLRRQEKNELRAY